MSNFRAQAAPEHLPRERVVIAARENGPCCCSAKLLKLAEDVTETLMVIRRRSKVTKAMHETFPCRQCKTINQLPAPPCRSEPAGDDPVRADRSASAALSNHQSERYAREGIRLNVSTLADQSGTCTAVLQPLHALDRANVLAARGGHDDDITVPIGRRQDGRRPH